MNTLTTDTSTDSTTDTSTDSTAESAAERSARSAAALVRAAQQGDARAYDELILRFEHYVWAVVRSFRLGDADAHDAVQITWLRLVENLDRLRDPERVGSWLATTASRECLRIKRRASREVGDVDQLEHRPDERFPAPEHHAVNDAMATVLWDQVASLPARGQLLLWALTRNDAPPYAELARQTGMPIGSIGPTRGRYLRRLRQHLEASGLGADSWR